MTSFLYHKKCFLEYLLLDDLQKKQFKKHNRMLYELQMYYNDLIEYERQFEL
jgi:hypothetical protein